MCKNGYKANANITSSFSFRKPSPVASLVLSCLESFMGILGFTFLVPILLLAHKIPLQGWDSLTLLLGVFSVSGKGDTVHCCLTAPVNISG